MDLTEYAAAFLVAVVAAVENFSLFINVVIQINVLLSTPCVTQKQKHNIFYCTKHQSTFQYVLQKN